MHNARANRSRLRDQGIVLLEMLIAALIMMFVGIALVVLVETSFSAQLDVQGQSVTDAAARQAVDTLADHLRDAQTSSATGTNEAICAASETSVQYYCGGANSTITYQLSGGNLQRIDGSGTPYTVLQNVQSLRFTYYKVDYASNPNGCGSYADVSGCWPTCTNATTPTTAELPFVAAIQVQVQVQLSTGYTETITSLARLRNSPPSLPAS